ncbi:transketolase family protein [Paralimibaculum aggregatum]|uniref:Transketolase family protein n=1 Tax=Paralimibaculum aggregatum TaxID=3036245 RepID=A0ABQ6LSL9_9RHOB|nr:transketolase C-terminal domain-containing protein [Limibaculum sp. NKW23]GMG85069.1 transketolase family protein [Limibaculum sp. NKW23]
MTGDPRTQGQDQSDLFTGDGSDIAAKPTVQGTPARALPAFVLGEELSALADADPRIVVLTADLASANRTVEFKARHPERFFDFGIAEKNMVTAAAGMAACGQIPFAATFASFLGILCAEQIRTDCAYPNLPVRLIAHHSGISMGYYGTSHHALEDIAMMRSIAGLTVACPADAAMLRAMLRASLDLPGALYLRLGRGRDPVVYPEPPADFAFGRAWRLREGRDLAIITTGAEVRPVLDAAAMLAAEGIETRVIDMATVKPLDIAEVRAAAAETGAVLTVEEHNLTGGLGSAVAEVLVEGPRRRFARHGVPDEFAPIGPPAALYAHYRLDAEGIAARARELLAAPAA